MSAHARSTDIASSHEAADSISDAHISLTKTYIMNFLHGRVATLSEIEGAVLALPYYTGSPQNVRSRAADLKREGMIVHVGFGVEKGKRRRVQLLATREYADRCARECVSARFLKGGNT